MSLSRPENSPQWPPNGLKRKIPTLYMGRDFFVCNIVARKHLLTQRFATNAKKDVPANCEEIPCRLF